MQGGRLRDRQYSMEHRPLFLIAGKERTVKEKYRIWAGSILLAGGIILIAAGIMRGEPATVLTKAAVICMECIGIG